MSRLNEIHDYLLSICKSENELVEYDSSSVYLSMEIMEYAHRNQQRVNGEPYKNHPLRCLENYRRLVGITDDLFCIDKDLLYENNIPIDGVQEVCILHDVVEDTDFTINEVEEIFNECDLGDYFRLYIKDALTKVTHNKDMDYESYVNLCLKNPISAICKMMDLQDNAYVLSLTELNEDNYERTIKYINYIYYIDSVYHFIENVKKYKDELKK